MKLVFLDEFILPDSLMVDSTLVGGLSGIDFHDGTFYLACDDPMNPRFFTATINIENAEIKILSIDRSIQIRDTSRYFDIEAIRYDTSSQMLVFASEGFIKNKMDPALFTADMLGNGLAYYNLPRDFYGNADQGPRHNGNLEGLSQSMDGKGYWVAMELPLYKDGPTPQLKATNSPVRITHIDTESKEPTRQFAYTLEPISKVPTEDFAINGLTDILQYDDDRFIILERSYSKGLGYQANTVRLFDVDASEATDVLGMKNLRDGSFLPATKTLLLDFEPYRDKLTNNSIDNIEGLCFGPVLPNGNRSLILVADNNFNMMGPQMNQFILLEIVNQFID
jgi:hypothetical protein